MFGEERRTGDEGGEGAMTRRPGTGGSRPETPEAASPAPEAGRPAKTPGLALPANLGKSLRLLDDEQFDRLIRAVTEEARRRRRGVPDDPTSGRGSKRPGQTKPTQTEPAASGKAATVTAGQERLILAAHGAGLRPAAIAREFRLSRAAVQDVIASAKRTRRGTGR